jgi:hypothetical protein
MRIVVLFVACLIGAVGYAADAVDSALNRILTKEQYEVLGVGTMSSDQKAALLEALRSAYSAGQAKAVDARPPARVSAPAVVPTGDAIESQIEGEFKGWDGETIVKLTNGQIWQQSEYHYEYHYAYRPEVLIYNSGGGFKMKVEDMDEAVAVRRLK